MKVLILSGSHPRHDYITEAINKFGFETFQIRMRREPLDVTPPSRISMNDKIIFIKHFNDRLLLELKYFGPSQIDLPQPARDVVEISTSELNSNLTVHHVVKFNPDVCIIFGTKLIQEPLFSALPLNTFNLHLGLSPWYRGAATLFWPFYLLEPQFAGITIHKITNKPDAGAIYHQEVPTLRFGQGIHDVANDAIKAAIKPLHDLLLLLQSNPMLPGIEPLTSGRIWRNQDFRPEHLRVIYNEFNNEIVDRYLEGSLGDKTPKLLSVL